MPGCLGRQPGTPAASFFMMPSWLCRTGTAFPRGCPHTAPESPVADSLPLLSHVRLLPQFLPGRGLEASFWGYWPILPTRGLDLFFTMLLKKKNFLYVIVACFVFFIYKVNKRFIFKYFVKFILFQCISHYIFVYLYIFFFFFCSNYILHGLCRSWRHPALPLGV